MIKYLSWWYRASTVICMVVAVVAIVHGKTEGGWHMLVLAVFWFTNSNIYELQRELEERDAQR